MGTCWLHWERPEPDGVVDGQESLAEEEGRRGGRANALQASSPPSKPGSALSMRTLPRTCQRSWSHLSDGWQPSGTPRPGQGTLSAGRSGQLQCFSKTALEFVDHLRCLEVEWKAGLWWAQGWDGDEGEGRQRLVEKYFQRRCWAKQDWISAPGSGSSPSWLPQTASLQAGSPGAPGRPEHNQRLTVDVFNIEDSGTWTRSKWQKAARFSVRSVSCACLKHRWTVIMF